MTDQSIPEALRGKATIFTGSNPAAPHGHTIALADVGSNVYLLRCGEIVGHIEWRLGLNHMYVGPGIAGGWYRGADWNSTTALALIAEAAARGRSAAELAEAKRELDALQASLRARDERIARQDEEIDAFGAEIDALRKWIAKQAAANAWAKATAPRPEHRPAAATAEAYLGEVGPATDDEESAPSPGMREVPAGEWRDGDTIRGIWHQHAPQSGKGCLPFAESRMGGLTEVMATRTVAPLPTNQHAVIRCIAMRGTTVRDAREIVAELRYDCWHGTDRYTYRPQDIVRVIAVLSPGDEIPAPPIKRETVESLPTLPGSVGKATVAKLGRTRVFLLDAESKYPWAALTDQGYDWFETSDLADYEPELDGQEA